ncbi:hypothetical protein E3N88_28435 [Mikania micrantha]|uniref:Integrase catalytic domain-containing protein n=1 Tax=Mikania micrantha TaxID=192012 RepID=A0A5N6N120_9ASTR|nr:hypothetical protein E3N88_28435 [Mikania micrantha]
MIREGQVKKPNKQGKGKGKKPWVTPSGKGKAVAKFKKQEQKPAAKAPTKAPKNPNCFHCGEPNHWKRDCPKYLAEMKKNPVGAGTSARVAVEAIGEYSLLLPSGLYLKLNNVCYVPSLTRNIISAARLHEQGFTFGFHEGNILTFKSNVMYFEARPHNGIYEVDIHGSCSDNSIYALNTKRLKTNFNQTYLWHCRLGHINKKRMSKLQTDGILKPTGSESFDICESCLCGKMTKAPFTGIGGRASDLLGLIHTDVCGPFRIMSRSGERYFITFTDDFSRYGYVYLLKHKHEAFEVFKVFQNEVQNQLGKTIKAIRSDRGGEYLSYDFNEHLKKCGIISQLTPPGTPQHNGVSERRNRTLIDMVRSMMSRANLPHSFWSYALETAACIVNMVPTKKVDKTPYELWYGRKPNLSYLRVWGCEAYVKRETSNKLDPKGEKGMDGNNVDLDEVQDSLNVGPEVETIDQQITVEPEPCLVQAPIVTHDVRRSERIRREPERFDDIYLVDQSEPTNYKSATSDIESDKWLKAMDVEMQSMYDNQVWDLVDLPPNSKAVGSKWIFKKKTDMDGNVHTFKARLVAKGFTQTQEIDNEETFSPVAMTKSIRILIAIAAYHDYEIWQMDVKTAFLNGHLNEDVYMVQPEGFVNPKYPDKVCKLKKSIYGLKQASRSWNLHFDEKIKEYGFIKNEDEPCVYMKTSGSIVVFLILYVDDILLIGNHIPILKDVKSWLSKCFAMKDLGEAVYILGIKIYRDRSKRLIGLSQSAYIDKVVKRFSMQDAKKGLLPMAHGTVLDKSHCPSSDKEIERMKGIPYASAIGSIMYAMLCTRPDVSYALSMTSRYQQNPGERHWVAVKNILKYLRRTKDMFLVYGGVEEELTVVAQSTTESEYIAASEAAKEAAWMKKFITDLKVVPSIERPIEIFCDNSGAIAQAKEPRSHHINKHIQRTYHYIREIVERGDVIISKVQSDLNVADPFTKPMPQAKHESHASSIGLRMSSDLI